MELVFTTDNLVRAKRYSAWQAAICDFYVFVDVRATQPDDYRGFIREAHFGDVVLTDILVSEQSIRRNGGHISRLDKDCYYLQLVQQGRVNVLQQGETQFSNPARGAIFYATEQYELQCIGQTRSFYIEVPRTVFARRFATGQIPITATVNTTQGLGRIAAEFCNILATEAGRLDSATRAQLGDQLLDLLAAALIAPDGDMPMLDGSIQKARLRSVQQWIEAHVGDPDLSLERIAAANGMSLRYLHQIFRHSEMSASEWIWSRRLQLSYDKIAKGEGGSITSIAFNHGFNSSAHFSTAFRRKYGCSPREIARKPR